MSNEIDTHFQNQFGTTLYHLVQQKGTRLRPCVIQEELHGEYGFYDQIGATSAIERSSRHSDSPMVNTPHSRRRVHARDFEWGDYIDRQDVLRMGNSPSAQYMQAAAWSLGRKLDDLIIEAALGTAYTGKTGATPVALPSSQKIAAASSGLTLAKLLTAKELLDAADSDPEEPRYMAVTARQVTNLLNTTQVTSADYNSVKALASGEVNTFLGFKFIRTQRLTVSGGNRQCFAWVHSGLLLAMPEQMRARIQERPDKAYSNYVYGCVTAGAARMEEQKIVEILCQE